MDAVEFIKEHDRMCDSYGGDCTNCEFHKETKSSMTCHAYVFAHPQKAVEIVERWAKEHPRKTRQSEFLKMFPRVGMCSDGFVNFCPEDMDSEFKCPRKTCDSEGNHCTPCRRKYWLEEVGE